MVTIVDYDNLPSLLRSKGPRTVAEILSELLASHVPLHVTDITIKFYGGWYTQSSLTQQAQLLHSALYDEFPFIHSAIPEGQQQPRKFSVSGALAHSLEINPKQTLPNTLRERSRRRKGRWDLPSACGCTNSQCPLSPVVDSFHADRCWMEGCVIKPSALVSPEPEQKMVDTQ